MYIVGDFVILFLWYIKGWMFFVFYIFFSYVCICIGVYREVFLISLIVDVILNGGWELILYDIRNC